MRNKKIRIFHASKPYSPPPWLSAGSLRCRNSGKDTNFSGSDVSNHRKQTLARDSKIQFCQSKIVSAIGYRKSQPMRCFSPAHFYGMCLTSPQLVAIQRVPSSMTMSRITFFL